MVLQPHEKIAGGADEGAPRERVRDDSRTPIRRRLISIRRRPMAIRPCLMSTGFSSEEDQSSADREQHASDIEQAAADWDVLTSREAASAPRSSRRGWSARPRERQSTSAARARAAGHRSAAAEVRDEVAMCQISLQRGATAPPMRATRPQTRATRRPEARERHALQDGRVGRSRRRAENTSRFRRLDPGTVGTGTRRGRRLSAKLRRPLAVRPPATGAGPILTTSFSPPAKPMARRSRRALAVTCGAFAARSA